MYDYVAGKADWVAMGMPTEGNLSQETIQDTLRRDVPTCGIRETLDEVKKRMSADWGILRGHRFRADRAWPVATQQTECVSTEEVSGYVDETKQKYVLVTKSTGELIGAIRAT